MCFEIASDTQNIIIRLFWFSFLFKPLTTTLNSGCWWKQKCLTHVTTACNDEGESFSRFDMTRKIVFVTALCWKVILLAMSFLSPETSPTWTKNGFKNMHGFHSECKKHEKAKSHTSAYKNWKTFGTSALSEKTKTRFYATTKRLGMLNTKYSILTLFKGYLIFYSSTLINKRAVDPTHNNHAETKLPKQNNIVE